MGGVHLDYMWSPARVLAGLDQESWYSLHPDGLHQESSWSIPGV